MSERQAHLYGNLFFLLQNEPKYIAQLARLLSISEIDGKRSLKLVRRQTKLKMGGGK